MSLQNELNTSNYWYLQSFGDHDITYEIRIFIQYIVAPIKVTKDYRHCFMFDITYITLL